MIWWGPECCVCGDPAHRVVAERPTCLRCVQLAQVLAVRSADGPRLLQRREPWAPRRRLGC